MNDVQITVGGDFEAEASQKYLDASRRAGRGEVVPERRLAFESWDTLSQVLTGKRMELLHCVRRHEIGSIRALARALGGDCSNVHADVRALADAGLLDTSGHDPRRGFVTGTNAPAPL